ncbi:MAG: sulfur carrier protein ThiS [Nitratireductor sp.]
MLEKIKLSVNGETKEISATLFEEALIELGFKDAKVATAINGAFISQDARKDVVLKNGDQVEILAPMQGG